MAQFNPNLDDEPLIDASVPIAGVDNARPPSAIDKMLMADAVNRLTQQDGLNRPRPGITRKADIGNSFDSIHHFGEGRMLVNDAGNWFIFDSRSNTLTAKAGGPAYTHGDQVYSALADQVLYFSRGGNLYKYDPNAASGAGAFGQNIIPSPYLTALYPIWSIQRLIYVWKNTLVISDILNPEAWNTTTQILTLDPIESDFITGQCLWRNQAIAVFRNGSTSVIETGPGLPVLNWEINRASATIGCCAHGTIVQCGTDVYFLSETGRGVYALSQMPVVTTSGQSQGVVWQPISAPIKRYIDRINWSAVANARATYWNDLYMLSVPLDGITYNNFILIYSVSLGTWQGIWCVDSGGEDLGVRDFARDRTNPDKTYLAIGTIDGFLSQFSYPIDRQYSDQDIDATQHPVESSLMTRGFTFGEDVNQIQPHGALLQFIESSEDVDITIWMDRSIEGPTRTISTNTFLLSLPIPSFPFDLDGEGYKNQPISLLGLGLCAELQLELSGNGNWTVYQLKTTAFEAMPLALA